MNTTNKKNINRWMRILHRDIGFFAIGLIIIYCVSGIMLTYRDTGFLKNEIQIKKSLVPGLNSNQLFEKLREKKLKLIEENGETIQFTNGTYDVETGDVTYSKKEIPSALKALNKLHIAPSENHKHFFTILYAAALLFLAVSSFWMYRPNSKYFRRGIVTASLGVIVSVVLVIF